MRVNIGNLGNTVHMSINKATAHVGLSLYLSIRLNIRGAVGVFYRQILYLTVI